MSLVDRIRQLVEASDPNGTVTVKWLGQLLEQEGATDQAPRTPAPLEPLADLTVDEVARALRRGASTVRGWLQSGALDGYRLNGREWRVTRDAMRAFQNRQAKANAAQTRSNAQEQASADSADTSAWRKHFKAAS